MNGICTLSPSARAYLDEFRRILDTMIFEMTQAELTDSISHNFITQMIPHHRAAIRMSENLLRYPALIPLQKIALNIIRTQTQSIADMERALPVCQSLTSAAADLNAYQIRNEEIFHTMFTEMAAACADDNISADFMREMIPHHEGAIRMAKNALDYPLCPELIPILNAIITSQENGVRQMRQLLSQIIRP